MGIARLAAELAPGHKPALTVIDGPAGAEGAFIAQMAVHDAGLQGYVVRASKLLADSNFMGSSYTLKFGDTRQVLAELHRLGVQHVVIVRPHDLSAYPHSRQMRDARGSSTSPRCAASACPPRPPLSSNYSNKEQDELHIEGQRTHHVDGHGASRARRSRDRCHPAVL